ncbi:MAG: aromatic ring-hydroxylating oxygenase subunit alpha, partial [Acetobacteraceae bacterium]
MTAGTDMLKLLHSRPKQFTLPQPFYTDPDFYQLDLKGIYERRWVFAGLEAEIRQPGEYFVVTIAHSSIVVLRDDDNRVAAFFNTCRHRGSTICPPGRGKARSLACPYHQWTYNLKGKLTYSGGMHDDFESSKIALKPVPVEVVAGMIYVCLNEDAPDFSEFSSTLSPYLEPHELGSAKLAWQEDIVFNANWKLVIENSRECYHCPARHPELVRTFFLRFDVAADETYTEHARKCEAIGLKSGNAIGDDYQLGRMPLTRNAISMTMDGKPICKKLLGRVPEQDIGSMRWFHFPSMFAHVLGDYAFFFQALPLAVDKTLVTSKWLVAADAEEGRDYDIKTLAKLWSVTNDQDRDLCERNQEGVSSLGFQPGPYSQNREGHVIKFVEWYADAMENWL